MEELPEAGERLEAVGRRFVVGPAPSLWSPPPPPPPHCCGSSPPPPPLEPLPPPRLLLEDRSFASCTQACYLYIGHHQVQSPSYIPRWQPEPLNRAQVSEDRAVHGQSARYGLSSSVNVSQCQCPATDGIPRSQTICDAPLQIFASGRPTR